MKGDVMFKLTDGFYVSQNGLLVGESFKTAAQAMESENYNKNGLTTFVVKIVNGEKAAE